MKPTNPIIPKPGILISRIGSPIPIIMRKIAPTFILNPGFRCKKSGSVAKIILLPFCAIIIVFCIIIDLFRAYKYPICGVFHWFCKIARFFATEPSGRPDYRAFYSGC
jgi:hypothetical protein